MNGPNILNSMNMEGGIATSAGSGARLVSGLVSGLKTAVSLVDKLVDSSKKFAENMTKGGGAVRTPSGFVDDAGSGMSFGSFARGVARGAAVVGTAAAQALDLPDFAENALARQRFGFFSGQGAAGASMTFQGMMNRGISTDRMDAVRAGMMATSMGLMPTLPGYQNVTGGAEMFSRLVPGAGLTGGMQATAALNQASSVNRLRMIGIQVRDPSTGAMRNPSDIANDVWNKINSQKTGGRPISKQDIAISLQSGNALDMMLNQYFGNDPVLRQGVVTALMQKASGGDFSQKSLNETGALPDLAVSTAQRNAASFGALDAYTGAAEQGMIGANSTIAAAANTMRDSAEIFSGAVTAFTFAMQLSGGAGGGLGTLAGGLIGGAANFAGSFLGSRGGLKGGLGNLSGSLAFKGASKLVPAAGAAVQGVSSFQQGQAGQGFDLGGTLLSSALAAGLGFLTGGPAGAAIAGGVTLGGSLLGYGLGAATSGEGDGEDEKTSSRFNPLEELRINAAWRKKRDYLIDGKPPANPYHTGVDYGVAENTQVFAVKDGVVVSAKDAGDKGFGKSIAIKHGDGYTSLYAHLNAHGVKAGDTVKAGQVIGLSGNTGHSSGPHLHFEVRENGNDQTTNVDPVAYISGSSRPRRASDFSASSAAGTSEETTGLLGSLSSGTSLLPGLSGAPSPGGEGDGGGISATTNYGGVTVNINVPKGTNINEQVLAKEIKRVLSDQDMLKRAVTR